MKLTKRRSVPVLPTPHPSTPPYPIERSESTTSLIPSTPRFLPRIPFRRRGQSAGPELQLFSGHDHDYAFGAEDAVTPEAVFQTQTQEQSGVFALSNDDCRLPVNPIRTTSAFTYTSPSTHTESMAVSDEQAGQGICGRRRDSTGQNRYPPNSLEPGNGWGFGRMRKSRKQAAKVVAPLRRDSLL